MTNYEIPECPSPQVKAVLHYLDQVKVLNLHEIEKIFTDDFVQTTQPLSLGIPSRTKEEDLAFLQGLLEQQGGRPIKIDIFDIIDSPGRAWAHVYIHGEPPVGKPFNVESIDFVDSAALAAMG